RVERIDLAVRDADDLLVLPDTGKREAAERDAARRDLQPGRACLGGDGSEGAGREGSGDAHAKDAATKAARLDLRHETPPWGWIGGQAVVGAMAPAVMGHARGGGPLAGGASGEAREWRVDETPFHVPRQPALRPVGPARRERPVSRLR